MQFNRNYKTTDVIFSYIMLKYKYLFTYYYNKMSLMKIRRYGIKLMFPGGQLYHNFQFTFSRPNFELL
jgi:hypothetical protein